MAGEETRAEIKTGTNEGFGKAEAYQAARRELAKILQDDLKNQRAILVRQGKGTRARHLKRTAETTRSGNFFKHLSSGVVTLDEKHGSKGKEDDIYFFHVTSPESLKAAYKKFLVAREAYAQEAFGKNGRLDPAAMPALAVLIEQDKKFLNEQIRETFFSKDEGYTKTRKMQNFFHARGGRISEKLKKLSRTERALVLAVPGTLVAALVALFDGGTASGVGLYTLLKFVFATGGTVVVSSASSYGVIKAADRLAATKAGKPEESISVEELEKALSTRDEYRAKTDSANIAIGMGIGAFLGGSFQQMCHAFGITPFTLAHPVSGPKVNPVEQNVPVPKPRPNVYVPQEVKITHPSHKIVVAPVPPALVEASTVKTTPPPEAPAIIAPEVLSTPSETIPQHGNIYCLYPDGHLSKGFPKWHHHSNIPDYANFRSRGTTVTGENFDHYYNEVNPHPVNLNDPSGKLDSEWFVREKLDDVTSFHSNRTGETLITNTGGGFTVDTDPHIDDNFRERIFEKAKTDFFSGPNPKPFVFVDVVTGNISAPPSAVTPQMQVTPTGRRIPMQAPVPQK